MQKVAGFLSWVDGGTRLDGWIFSRILSLTHCHLFCYSNKNSIQQYKYVALVDSLPPPAMAAERERVRIQPQTHPSLAFLPTSLPQNCLVPPSQPLLPYLVQADDSLASSLHAHGHQRLHRRPCCTDQGTRAHNHIA